MLNLIIKDYIFTRKQAIIGILFCLATPVLLIIDGGSKNYWAQFFIPYCLTSFLLGKIFFMEDTTDVRCFLKLLPYSVGERVLSRFCFMGITLCIAEVYLWGVQWIFFQEPLLDVIRGNIIAIIIFLIYFSLYITLSYCMGYLAAQNTLYICMIIAGVLAIAYEKFNFSLNFALLGNKYTILLLFLASGCLIFFFFFLSCKGVGRREN